MTKCHDISDVVLNFRSFEEYKAPILMQCLFHERD